MRLLQFSHFTSARDNHPKPMEMSWDDFKLWVMRPRTPRPVPSGDDPKKGMPAFSPAVFEPGMTRSVGAVKHLNFLVFDYDNSETVGTGEYYADRVGNLTLKEKTKKVMIDNPVSMVEVANILRTIGVDHVLYKTWSDTQEWPHFRLIMPLGQSIQPSKWDASTGWFIDRLGLIPTLRGVDRPVLKDVARLYFLPGGPHAQR